MSNLVSSLALKGISAVGFIQENAGFTEGVRYLHEWVELGKHLFWPLATSLIFFFIRKPIRRLIWILSSLIKKADNLTLEFQGVSFKVEGGKAKELLEANLGLIENMTQYEQQLLRIISEQPPDVGLLLTNSFQRTSKSDDKTGEEVKVNKYHETLQLLRDRSLIRPQELGSWRPGKHAIITRIGKILLKDERFRKSMLAPGDPEWWDGKYEPEGFIRKSN